MQIMQSKGFDQVPVTSNNGQLTGLITLGNLLAKLTSKKVKPSDPVSAAAFTFDKVHGDKRKTATYVEITENTKLQELSAFFETFSSALVTEGKIVKHVVTKVDLVSWLMQKV